MKRLSARHFFAVLVSSWVFVATVEAATPCIWFGNEHTLYQINTDSNLVAQTVTVKGARGLGMNGSDCGTTVLARKQLFRFDADGALLQTIDLRSLDRRLDDADQVLVDPYDNSVWLRDGNALFHLDANSQLIGSWMAPKPIRSFVLALDQSVWLIGSKQLSHYSAQGTLLASYSLMGMVDAEPKLLAIDSLGGLLWLAGEKHLVQLNLKQPAQAPVNVRLPREASAMTLNPLTGELWIATTGRLLSYGRDGRLINTIDFRDNKVRQVSRLAFDPATQALWALSEHAISCFTAQGQFIISLPADDDGAVLAVPAFTLTPTLSLVRPAANGLTNNALPPITYGFDALCNSRPCAFAPDYFSSYSLAATLNQKSISPFAFDATSGQSSYTPTVRLPEGLNVLSAQAKDGFGHATNPANDIFTIDTVPPRFVSLSPAEGSVVSTPNIVLQGVIDDPSAVVVLNGVGTATNTTVNGATLTFSMPVTLVQGTNSLVVTAIDRAGNATTQTLRLAYEPNQMEFKFTSPVDGATVADDTVLVSGTFKASANTGITINGVVAAQVDNRFYAQVPLQPGANVLTLTATAPTGATMTQTINVASTGISPFQVVADATSGVAPLTVNFIVRNNTGNRIAGIDADFNGDGASDLTTSDPAAALQFVYTVPGTYRANFRITDSQGNVADKFATITVQDRAALDQMLKTQWNGMNDALKRGDKAAALNYLNTQAKDKYGRVFDVLQARMPAIIDSYSPPQAVSITGELGEYAINRNIGGVNNVFLIYFLRDMDGVWRLDSM